MAVPTQHPAVVLRSQYKNLRNLLVIAMIVVAGLTAAVVILATDDAPSPVAGVSASAAPAFQMPSHARLHGAAPVPDLRFVPLPNGERFDGGPDEGSRGVVITQSPDTRADGGPEEGTRGPGR